MKLTRLRSLFAAALLAFAPSALVGCMDTGSSTDDVTDVAHTDVERQSIGNCWLYAQASWVESMHLSATGIKYDVSQSYWTYWHWFDQITGEGVDEIETGGGQYISNQIVLERGLIPESKFIKEDTTSEMSTRQSTALSKLNDELKTGRLKDWASRSDKALVRKVLDEAWQLSSTVKGQMTKAFGKTYDKTLLSGGVTKGTPIVAAKDFVVQYPTRDDDGVVTIKKTTLDVAIDEWHVENYPTYGSNLASKRRDFQIRVQRALHHAAPVVITWNVDFNAMEGTDPVLKGSFNLTTLGKSGKPGRQGGHMTVLEDYEVSTKQYGLLKAGVTLDGSKPEDAKKLEAALLPDSEVKFFRIKNSWGALRDDRSSAPGFPGYHDLYMDYLNGPIAFCPEVEGTKDPKTNCKSTVTPFEDVMLPPGF